MNLDLFVDTSRKGISMALSQPAQGNATPLYVETVDETARGETASAILDELLNRVNATLDDIKRVMVTVGPGSFSGLRTGVAFCQGLCFSGKRSLYGVSTLKALECFASEASNIATIIRARNGYWYLRRSSDATSSDESFIPTEEVIRSISELKPAAFVVDDAALADELLSSAVQGCGVPVVNEKNQPLSAWAKLFETEKPNLIQEANYIQPSYFEKLK